MLKFQLRVNELHIQGQLYPNYYRSYIAVLMLRAAVIVMVGKGMSSRAVNDGEGDE